ncbi:MAG: hypothetical protein KatS3mg023_2864 [Armatimonadota bacterium]|nr:MAG: hypothetical protein KatS3mg023_2864 [Armatimonadota bacterium]
MKSVKALILGAVLLLGVSVLPSLFLPVAPHQPTAWSAAAQDVAIVEGKVLSIGEESFVMQVRRVRHCDLKGLTVTVVWDENTQWTRGKRTASPDELWVGAAVTVSGTVVEGVLYADTVQIGGGGKR